MSFKGAITWCSVLWNPNRAACLWSLRYVFVLFSLHATETEITGILSNHDGDAEDKEFKLYLRMSWYSKVIYFVYHCHWNYLLKLNLEQSDIPWNTNLKNWPLRFTFSRERTIWSFYVVVLQKTENKCTKNFNTHAQPLFCSWNLLFSAILLP